MKSHRYIFATSGMIAWSACTTTALAQDDPDALIRTMIECADIAEMADRVACYDRTVAQARVQVAQAEEQAASRAVAIRENFGSETMPRQANGDSRPDEPLPAITATITHSREAQPGYYVVSLDDGSEWRFTERAASFYFPPRNGTQVTIERGALGSYRMQSEGKRPVRVRRIR